MEKECLAVVKAIQHFKIYLTGVRFRVYTDHACLRSIQEIGDTNGRLARWSIFLQQHDFEIVHRPGTTHGNADGLTRQSWNYPPTPTLSAREGGEVWRYRLHRQTLLNITVTLCCTLYGHVIMQYTHMRVRAQVHHLAWRVRAQVHHLAWRVRAQVHHLAWRVRAQVHHLAWRVRAQVHHLTWRVRA